MDGLGVVHDEVEDGALLGAALDKAGTALAVGTGPEEALENQPRIRLGRERGGGGAPGEIGLVGAGVAGIAAAGFPVRVGGEFQRGEAGGFANGLGGDLIHGDAGEDVAAGGFLDPHAG